MVLKGLNDLNSSNGLNDLNGSNGGLGEMGSGEQRKRWAFKGQSIGVRQMMFK